MSNGRRVRLGIDGLSFAEAAAAAGAEGPAAEFDGLDVDQNREWDVKELARARKRAPAGVAR